MKANTKDNSILHLDTHLSKLIFVHDFFFYKYNFEIGGI